MFRRVRITPVLNKFLAYFRFSDFIRIFFFNKLKVGSSARITHIKIQIINVRHRYKIEHKICRDRERNKLSHIFIFET